MYICMHECTCACAHRNGRSRGLDHGRHLNYVSRPILNSLSFSPLTRVSFLETVRGMHAPPLHRSGIDIIFFSSPLSPLPSIHLCHFCQLTFNWAKTKKKQKKKKVSLSFIPAWRDALRVDSSSSSSSSSSLRVSGASDSEFKLFYPWIANKLAAWHLWYYYVITAATRRDVPSLLCLSLSLFLSFSLSLCRLLIYRILLRRVTLKGRPL